MKNTLHVTAFAALALAGLLAGGQATRDILWCPVYLPGVPCFVGPDKPKPPAPPPPPKCPPPPKPKIETQPCHPRTT